MTRPRAPLCLPRPTAGHRAQHPAPARVLLESVGRGPWQLLRAGPATAVTPRRRREGPIRRFRLSQRGSQGWHGRGHGARGWRRRRAPSEPATARWPPASSHSFDEEGTAQRGVPRGTPSPVPGAGQAQGMPPNPSGHPGQANIPSRRAGHSGLDSDLPPDLRATAWLAGPKPRIFLWAPEGIPCDLSCLHF